MEEMRLLGGGPVIARRFGKYFRTVSPRPTMELCCPGIPVADVAVPATRMPPSASFGGGVDVSRPCEIRKQAPKSPRQPAGDGSLATLKLKSDNPSRRFVMRKEPPSYVSALLPPPCP